jgi:hypothetical protein
MNANLMPEKTVPKKLEISYAAKMISKYMIKYGL